MARTPDFSAVPHGLLPAGTVTPEGVVLGRSDAFARVHGPYRPASPLVVLR